MLSALARGRVGLAATRRLATLREKAGQKDPLERYEPKFEDPREYPEFPVLNVRLQGYDFVPLEKYQSFVDKIARRFNFPIVESYAVAAQTCRALTYKPQSTIVADEIELAVYDRVVRIGPVPAPKLQLFTQMIRAHCPVGVTITIKEATREDEQYRYIPDLMLKEKQEELKSLDNPIVRKNLGWE
ncbi:unnamed protein product, partial [Mesorhabditis belari]|uniref:Ribosomal protein S10 domain-containing protein n=1 Tax=Mesorhabditis belari TaxID=2138241 RepID=A0AAF3EIT7_9BILA